MKKTTKKDRAEARAILEKHGRLLYEDATEFMDDLEETESRLKWAEDLLKVAHGLILVAEQQTPKIQIAYESFLSDIAKGFPGGEKE